MTNMHIEEVDNLYSQLSDVQHDLKHHFSVMSEYAKNKDYASICEYLESLGPSIEYTPYRIGNTVLDALISTRALSARAMKIDFDVRVSLPKKMPLSTVDLSILFGNLLDNAFEAVEQLPEEAERFIKVATKSVECYWVVVCQNTSNDQSLQSLDPIPSSKADKELHGLGTRKICEIARSTGGYVSFEQKNNVFTTIVMLMFNSDTNTAK